MRDQLINVDRQLLVEATNADCTNHRCVWAGVDRPNYESTILENGTGDPLLGEPGRRQITPRQA